MWHIQILFPPCVFYQHCLWHISKKETVIEFLKKIFNSVSQLSLHYEGINTIYLGKYHVYVCWRLLMCFKIKYSKSATILGCNNWFYYTTLPKRPCCQSSYSNKHVYFFDLRWIECNNDEFLEISVMWRKIIYTSYIPDI